MVPARSKRLRAVGEKGYVLALVALMILPLVGFTGFAVDLGAWYGRAAQIQRAADAAALAGVQKLPNLPSAVATAKAVAAQNGFVDGADGITVTVVQVPDITAKLSVTIEDDDTPQYFTQMFRDGVMIKRTGTAQFLKPLQMGSPKNFLGTGTEFMQGGSSGSCGTNTTGKCFRENYWLAVSGGCSSKENGDRVLAISDANFTNKGGWNKCAVGGNVIANPEYDSNGYYYAIEFYENVSGTYKVEIFDAPYCTSAPLKDSMGSFSTIFTLRNNNSLDPRLATEITHLTISTAAADCGKWKQLGTINNPTKGVYYVQVQTEIGGSARNGTNGFALRAYSGSWAACTSTQTEAITGAVEYKAGCPNVYGYGAMGVQADAEANPAVFYLTEIKTHDYDGKQLLLELWDPGEGARAIQILDPLGNPVEFQWQVMCYNNMPPNGTSCADGTTAPKGGWTGTSGNITGIGANALDIAGSKTTYNSSASDPQPGSNRTSDWKYSDRLLQLTIQLPDDIPATYGDYTWFKIRYWTFGNSVTDRTTWSATIQGAPVRLIPNP